MRSRHAPNNYRFFIKTELFNSCDFRYSGETDIEYNLIFLSISWGTGIKAIHKPISHVFQKAGNGNLAGFYTSDNIRTIDKHHVRKKADSNGR